MKKNIFFILTMFSIILLGCGDNDKNGVDPPVVPPVVTDPEISEYIESATISNKYNATVAINNSKHTLTVGLARNADKTDVKIMLKLAKGATMIAPQSLESEYNFSENPPGIKNSL